MEKSMIISPVMGTIYSVSVEESLLLPSAAELSRLSTIFVFVSSFSSTAFYFTKSAALLLCILSFILSMFAFTTKTETSAIRQKHRTKAMAGLSFCFLSCLMYVSPPINVVSTDKGKLILLITCNYDIMSPYVFSGSARANSLKFWNNRGDLTCQNIFWPERTKGIYR